LGAPGGAFVGDSGGAFVGDSGGAFVGDSSGAFVGDLGVRVSFGDFCAAGESLSCY
jgi:hypothetical protein